MSRPQFNRSQSNVEDWLSGSYEYISPHDIDHEKGTKAYAFTPKDPFGDITPASSDKGSSKDRSQRRQKTDRYRPMSPPSEDMLEKERARKRERDGEKDRDRDHDRYRPRKSSHSTAGHDSEKENRRPRHHRDDDSPTARYPPRADHGRPQRPRLNSAHTTPDFRAAREDRERERERERGREHRHRERRYSHSSSPPRHRDDKAASSRRHHHHHRRHGGDDPAPSSPHRSSHHSTTSGTSSKPRRPSLSHRHTAPGSGLSGVGSSARRTFSGLMSDPRFAAAAHAALEAGATAAVGAVGAPNARARVARAALGAAALGALKSPGESPAAAAASPPPAPAPAPAEMAAEKVGGYFADRVGHRKEGHRRRR